MAAGAAVKSEERGNRQIRYLLRQRGEKMITKRLSVEELIKIAAAELNAACNNAHFEPHVLKAANICGVLCALIKAEKAAENEEIEVIEWLMKS